MLSWVEAERPDLRHASAPDGTVTVLFSDIEHSTELTEPSFLAPASIDEAAEESLEEIVGAVPGFDVRFAHVADLGDPAILDPQRHGAVERGRVEADRDDQEL